MEFTETVYRYHNITMILQFIKEEPRLISLALLASPYKPRLRTTGLSPSSDLAAG